MHALASRVDAAERGAVSTTKQAFVFCWPRGARVRLCVLFPATGRLVRHVSMQMIARVSTVFFQPC